MLHHISIGILLLVRHVLSPNLSEVDVIPHHAFVFFALFRLPIHHLEQLADTSEGFRGAGKDPHTHGALHTDLDAQILFDQANRHAANHLQQGANPVTVHTRVEFGKLRNDLHAVANLALAAENDGLEGRRRCLVVEILAHVAIVWDLIEVEVLGQFLDGTGTGSRKLNGELRERTRDGTLMDNPAEAIEFADNVVHRSALGIGRDNGQGLVVASALREGIGIQLHWHRLGGRSFASLFNFDLQFHTVGRQIRERRRANLVAASTPGVGLRHVCPDGAKGLGKVDEERFVVLVHVSETKVELIGSEG